MADTSTPGVRKGGLVDKRMQAMEQAAGANSTPIVAPSTPAPAAAPVEVMSPEEKALRRRHGMAVPGEAKPTLLGKIKNALGFASKP